MSEGDCPVSGMHTDVRADSRPIEPDRRRLYVSVASKFVLSILFAACWVGASAWISVPWFEDLSDELGVVPAITILTLIAFLPGGVVAFLAASLTFDRQPAMRFSSSTQVVTIIIAARNEVNGIGLTVSSLNNIDYPAGVRVILADNGSTDGTAEAAQAAADRAGVDLRVIREDRPGKAHALNTALLAVDTKYVVTVDADTILHRDAMKNIVGRLESAPADTVAVAGSVLTRNSRSNLLTRMQEWDYYLGIAAVKRMQGLYQSTLVAQGAFSLYLTDSVRRVGGWPDAIGEDIVITWRLMEGGHRVYFEPSAVAFTDVPDDLGTFMKQRSRWARGMLEGLRAVPPWRQTRGLTKMIASVDLFIPLLDVGYVLIFLPGVVLAFLGYPLIVSLWTLAVLPVTMLIYGGLRRYQARNVFSPLGLTVRRNRIGYVAFLLIYQVLCSSASLVGYAQWVGRTRHRWK